MGDGMTRFDNDNGDPAAWARNRRQRRAAGVRRGVDGLPIIPGVNTFAVYNEEGKVADVVTLSKDGTKGYSGALGELHGAKLGEAVEMWQLVCQGHRIVDANLKLIT